MHSTPSMLYAASRSHTILSLVQEGGEDGSVQETPVATQPAQGAAPSSGATASMRGLVNLGGASCFMNATLQAMVHLSSVRSLLAEAPRCLSGFCSCCALGSLACELQGTGKAVSPKALYDQLSTCDRHRNIKERRALGSDVFQRKQCDAHTLLLALLDHADKCTTHKAALSDLFRGTQCSTSTCGVCGSATPKNEAFVDLSIELGASVDAALDSYLKEETLDGANQYQCGTCGKKCDGTKQLSLPLLPCVLVLHLKRGDAAERKAEEHVAFESQLQRNGAQFQLRAVIVHEGRSLDSGHYFSYVNECDQWALFKDADTPVPVAWEQVSKAEAYMLFYERISGAQGGDGGDGGRDDQGGGGANGNAEGFEDMDTDEVCTGYSYA